ncbi:MAG: CinA family protein [Halobacteria archaeon]|nr:CinA family protein [Halobacteria archaeon]
MEGDRAERVGELLRERDETLAVAESDTGGMVGARLSSVPGASDYFERGVTAYSYGWKLRSLGVARETLDEDGAVSEEVAREMARGVRDLSETTWGVSETGVAGPEGGTEEKPVGTVYVSVAYAGEWGTESSYSVVEKHEFEGGRNEVRRRTVDEVLDLLADEIEGRHEHGGF